MSSQRTIGVVSDIHSNEYALEAVLTDMPPVDLLVCLGDVIGYGPHPKQCTKRIRSVSDVILRGNHEVFLEQPHKCSGHREARKGVEHAQEELLGSEIDWLTNLPYRSHENIDNTDILFVHGHPNSGRPFQYVQERNAHELAKYVNEDGWHIIGVGHSHQQFQHRITNTGPNIHDAIIFNPGSVGQPRDGNPDAAYAVLTCSTDSMFPEIDLRRVEYDIEAVISDIHEVDLPRATGERLRYGKHPRVR